MHLKGIEDRHSRLEVSARCNMMSELRGHRTTTSGKTAITSSLKLLRIHKRLKRTINVTDGLRLSGHNFVQRTAISPTTALVLSNSLGEARFRSVSMIRRPLTPMQAHCANTDRYTMYATELAILITCGIQCHSIASYVRDIITDMQLRLYYRRRLLSGG